MFHLKSALQIIICLVFLLTLDACSSMESSASSESSSASSESSSDIASSPSSLSSSGSSKKYQTDVADYTYAYLKSASGTNDYASFKKGLAGIANKRGVSDWESDPHTYKGIGKGLKKAGIEGVAFDTFKENFANGNAVNMESIQEGYDSSN